ncbi:hypothetical protein [Nocardioides jishulii]|uniref:Uncharacterized protein n=1 Tax=Nocardioides jishulii TaxID=2575440 RepID=A0A4U2YKM5_9ACTN|nr:hypothetical protein [Nocardioides jishulii]TKI61709.1 hypothetical protein FC770_13190 [Nocardioides jishulii]
MPILQGSNEVWEDYMFGFGWLISLLTGAVAAVITVIIAVASLTGVDADHEGPGSPGAGQYGDD